VRSLDTSLVFGIDWRMPLRSNSTRDLLIAAKQSKFVNIFSIVSKHEYDAEPFFERDGVGNLRSSPMKSVNGMNDNSVQ